MEANKLNRCARVLPSCTESGSHMPLEITLQEWTQRSTLNFKKEKEKGEKSLLQIIAFSINDTFIAISNNLYALKTEANHLARQQK